MDDDDWKLEAIHEQFEVFNDLTPLHSIEVLNLKEVVSTTQSILKKHLRYNFELYSSIKAPAVRKISTEIINAVPESKNKINLSYIVIVTNQETNNKLSKIPVFVVSFGSNDIFIDITSSVYNSWEAYKSSNDLPACQICFPVDGRYNIGGKLAIDFAPSKAVAVNSKFWYIVGGVVLVGVGIVAASYFFKMSPTDFKWLQKVASFAEPFLPRLSDVLRPILEFPRLINKYRSGHISKPEFLIEIVQIFQRVYREFKDEIDPALENLKKELHKYYSYLKEKFGSYFNSAPRSSQHELAAIVCKLDSELDVSNANIFENCRDECCFLGKSKNYETPLSLKVSKTTDDLLTISENIANALNGKNDMKVVFQSLGSIFSEELQKEVRRYRKMVEAARAAAGHDIDVVAFNKTLGIEGSVEEHYTKEVMQNLQKSRLLHSLKEKIAQVQEQKKIEVILIWKKSEDSCEGIYKCVGLRGAGKFSTKDVINVLKEDMSIRLNNEQLVINETEAVMYISYKKLTILAYQEIDEESTSDGFIYIERNSE